MVGKMYRAEIVWASRWYSLRRKRVVMTKLFDSEDEAFAWFTAKLEMDVFIWRPAVAATLVEVGSA